MGEVVVLLGPSGCGKTTLLRIIAGLDQADNGRLLLQGEDLTRIPVHQRGFGMVFQEYALFPHRNVFENVAFGLRMAGWERPQIVERVQQVLALVGLAGYDQRSVHELSGGEQQRVALARSLAPAPRLILLDEPLGALDRALRERLMLELRDILKRAGGVMGRPEGITAVYVTHDQAEAFAIADQIIVMNQGQIEQQADPVTLYRQPATPFVARFLGMENLLPGEVKSTAPCIIHTEIGELHIETAESLTIGQPITLLIRPEAAQPISPNTPAPNQITAHLTSHSFRGRYQIATFTLAPPHTPITLKFEFDSSVNLRNTQTPFHLSLNPNQLIPLERG
ncbi:MAG: ABC transporter ATP-binding protein [Chloroflexi bacterium]|nr:MAG: ABC transporter ATP-binding protein [Chloroflexota bacterium]